MAIKQSLECGKTLIPKWIGKYVIPFVLAAILIFVGYVVSVVGYIATIGIVIAVMLVMSLASLEKCWDTERTVLHFMPYIVSAFVLILFVLLTAGDSLALLGMTPSEVEHTGYDMTYAFSTFWYQLAAAVVSGGTPTINFTASIVMYGVAAFMMVYGDRMENSIIMLGGTLMCFAPMILAFVTVLLTGVPVGFFSTFASGFSLFGPAGYIIMAIICIIPDALIISVLMTIERLIPEPGEAETTA